MNEGLSGKIISCKIGHFQLVRKMRYSKLLKPRRGVFIHLRIIELSWTIMNHRVLGRTMVTLVVVNTHIDNAADLQSFTPPRDGKMEIERYWSYTALLTRSDSTITSTMMCSMISRKKFYYRIKIGAYRSRSVPVGVISAVLFLETVQKRLSQSSVSRGKAYWLR